MVEGVDMELLLIILGGGMVGVIVQRVWRDYPVWFQCMLACVSGAVWSIMVSLMFGSL